MSMRSIGTTPYGPQRPAAPTPVQPAPAATGNPATRTPAQGTPAVARRDTRDTVAISPDARALAARGPEAASASEVRDARAPLTAERVDELRRKVLEGAYDQANVVDQVAKRLLASGDV